MLKKEQAIVIGSSIGGLLAAYILTKHFDKVILIERDDLTETTKVRKGTPQAWHGHLLLLGGRIALDELFPGFSADMNARGALEFDFLQEALFYFSKTWAKRAPSDLRVLSCSRTLLESGIRARVMTQPNLSIKQNCEVTDLISNQSNEISGVKLRSREPNSLTEELKADFFVDASGRNSKFIDWLPTLGYERPEEIIVNPFIGYASRFYKPPQGFKSDWKMLAVRYLPPEVVRGGGIFPVEDGNWLVSLVGGSKDYPPTDEEGFLEFARSLRDPLIFDLLNQSEPLSPVHGFRDLKNQRWLCENMTRWPENFVVLGDAVCNFNPVYGQGMTAAIQGAVILGEFFKNNKISSGWTKQFQKKLARNNDKMWLLATSEDFKFPNFETRGANRNLLIKIMQWYAAEMIPLCDYDPDVFKTLLEVSHVSKPSIYLFKPSILRKMLLKAIR